jgi:hypothetical protein
MNPHTPNTGGERLAMHDELSPILIEDQVLTEGFVQVPVVVVFDPDLTSGAKTMYGALLWYAWKLGGAPTQTVMAEQLGGGRRTIQRHLRELEEGDYIETRMLGLGRPNEYVIRSLQNRALSGAPRVTLSSAPKMAHQVRQQRRTSCAKNGPGSIRQDSDSDSVDIRTDSESATDAGSDQLTLGSVSSDSDFAKAIRETATALGCPKDAKQLITLAQAEQWPEDLIRTAGRVVGHAIANGADVLKPGAYLTTAVRVMLSDRRQAAEVGKKKTADRRQDALAYARQIYADPIIGGNWRQVEAILRESYGQQVAAWVAEQLRNGG